ncbi:MAG: hypothetical protein KBF48_12965 [Xanthomonadales bacterium]|nr:hypothetical protein [Xanthomonadales bacterium]
MTTYTKVIGGGATVSPNAQGRKVVRRRIDCAVEAALQSLTEFGAADILQAITVPAGYRATACWVDVKKVEGGAATIDIGDGATADGYLNDVDINALGVTYMTLALTEAAPNTITRYTLGKTYTSADTIDITFNTAATAVAVFDVYVEFLALDEGAYTATP